MPEQKSMWKQRLAIQLVVQLPDRPEDAREVLDLARQLYDEFLVDKSRSARILALPEES